ncbi:MAG: zf-HC2 domain-containing protein [Planctomycetota bacterium]
MILTLDCEGSAHLTSESLDRPLNWAENLAVKIHRAICKKSRRLNRQLIQMHNQLHELEKSHASESYQLSTEARKRIASKLNQLGEN